MTVEALERAIAAKQAAARNPWSDDERMFHLVEEVGELFEIILHVRGAKQPPKDSGDVAIALADVLEDLCAVARIHGVSLQQVADAATNAG
jgi:NTP pyrophosphatase (non-canonical NTP hydrolase)